MTKPPPPTRRAPRIAVAVCALVLAATQGILGIPPEDVSGAPVGGMDVDPTTGDRWIGTLGGGLLRDSAGRVDRFTQFNSGLAGDVILDVRVWQGRVFCATPGGISGYDPGTNTWTLHLERRGDAPPWVVVGLAALPPDPSRPLDPTALHAVSSDGRVFRYHSEKDAWTPSDRRVAKDQLGATRRGEPSSAAPQSDTLAVGILNPMNRTISVPGADRSAPGTRADQLAVEEVLARRNARGGTHVGLSRPMFQYERYGWGTPEDTIAILALRPGVMGAVGYIGPGPSAGKVLAERLRFPVVDAAPDDSGADAVEDPWVFRCGGYGHDAQAALLDALLENLSEPRLAVVRTPGEESARRLDFWVRRAAKSGAPVSLDVTWNPEEDPGALLGSLRRAGAQAVLTWCDARTAARLLREMRGQGLRAALVGGAGMVDAEFARLAPGGAGTVLAVAPCSHAALDPPGEEGSRGDDAAASAVRRRSFEAAAHLLAAMDAAGPDRAAVRDELERMRSQAVARLENGAWRVGPASEVTLGAERTRRSAQSSAE